MSSSSHYDVIIVGGGPAGSSCATILAQHGVRVLVLEKARFPREKICGECINPRCWKLLELIGVADEFRNQGVQEIDTISITNRMGREVTASLSHTDSRPFFAMQRSVFDTILLRNAQHNGAEVREETQVWDVLWHNGWNVCARSTVSGEEAVFPCDDLVGADGRNSVVARRALRGYRDHGIPNKWNFRKPDRVGVQWHTHCQSQIDSAVEMFLFDGGYCGVVNVGSHHANIAMVVEPDVAPIVLSDFPKFITRTMFGNAKARKRFQDVMPLGDVRMTSPINPTHWRKPRAHVHLIGDANQLVEPFTGQGVFFALQDGVHSALDLLYQRGQIHPIQPPAVYSRFWLNRAYSPALRNGRLAQLFVALGARTAPLVSLAAKPVLDIV